jgi:hypothetical protein
MMQVRRRELAADAREQMICVLQARLLAAR